MLNTQLQYGNITKKGGRLLLWPLVNSISLPTEQEAEPQVAVVERKKKQPFVNNSLRNIKVIAHQYTNMEASTLFNGRHQYSAVQPAHLLQIFFLYIFAAIMAYNFSVIKKAGRRSSLKKKKTTTNE